MEKVTVGRDAAVEDRTEERRVGSERLGGRRLKRRERASAAVSDLVVVLGCAHDGVGGGAAVAPPLMFGSWWWFRWAEEEAIFKDRWDVEREATFI